MNRTDFATFAIFIYFWERIISIKPNSYSFRTLRGLIKRNKRSHSKFRLGKRPFKILNCFVLIRYLHCRFTESSLLGVRQWDLVLHPPPSNHTFFITRYSFLYAMKKLNHFFKILILLNKCWFMCYSSIPFT